jgi:hypothetical protein
MMPGIPRNPMVLVLLVVLAVLAALDHFLVYSPPVPAEYVGSWMSGPTRLEIRPDGLVEYRTGDGVVSHVIGGRLTRIGPDVLAYRVLYVPRRLRLDAPPHPRDDMWAMTVEGQELWRMP